MANKRFLNCGLSNYQQQEVYAIGQQGSFADLKEKINHCLNCDNSLGCKGLNTYLKQLNNVQDNYIYLTETLKGKQSLI